MTQSHATAGHEPVDEMISAAVRGLLAQRRLKKAEVALVVGISRTAFYNKLNNVSPWEAQEVDRLAKFFQVSRDSLFEGRADFQPPQSVFGSEGWGFESLRARPRRPKRRRTDRPRRHLALVPAIYVTAA